MDRIFAEEQEHLEETREKYREIVAENRKFFQALPGLYPGDSDLLNDLLLQAHNRIARLEQGMGKPYFARIDFTTEEGVAERYYMGKIGVLDGEERMVTLDWRAPVSTLYYDSNVGPVSYDSPGGRVHGRLELKRQLEVEKGELLSYTDVDTVANDELLRPYLGVSADNRLKNIISTIQTEQNRIIRAGMERNIIVQGAAGSGKTTVALHRIAYLVYHHRETIRPEQYLVIGPNRFFISYISAVLPDLDVDSVPQRTYADLAREILEEPFQLADPYRKLAQRVSGADVGSIERHKTSMAYKAALDRFLGEYESTILPPGGFALRGFPVLGEEDLQEGWNRGQDCPADTVAGRVEHCILYLSGLVENRSFLLDNQLSHYFKERYGQPGVSLDELHRDRAWIEKELAGGCKKSLGKFFSRVNVKILALYRLFLQDSERYLDPAFSGANLLGKQTLATLRKKTLDGEDLPALLYLKERMQGGSMGRWKQFRHAVVDEAQDFGEFDLYALQKVLGGCTFTVVGDLAQSVFAYRGVENWETVRQQSFDRGTDLCGMEKSYRTTVEIMEAANRVTALLGLDPSQPVIRHGQPVGIHRVAGREAARMACRLVEQYRLDGCVSVALLCKTEEELAEMTALLLAEGLRAQVITSSSEGYESGVCAMTGYLSKGLEFDGVIVWNGADTIYNADSRLDLHLLYVAMTRPLHRLDILCGGNPCKPLRETG